MFFFLGRAEWCSLPFSWDTKSSFIRIQNHFSGFFGKKRFFCHFDITLNFDIRESDLKSTSTFTFGTLPWLLFAFPSFFICTLSHCWDLKWKSRRSENVLAFEGAPWKDLWPKLRFWTQRSWKSQKIKKRFDVVCMLRPFQAYYYHF